MSVDTAVAPLKFAKCRPSVGNSTLLTLLAASVPRKVATYDRAETLNDIAVTMLRGLSAAAQARIEPEAFSSWASSIQRD